MTKESTVHMVTQRQRKTSINMELPVVILYILVIQTFSCIAIHKYSNTPPQLFVNVCVKIIRQLDCQCTESISKFYDYEIPRP